MAAVKPNIRVSCGCGWKGTVEEAIQHCEETGHTLTVLGTISKGE